jgi:hypothetical protein
VILKSEQTLMCLIVITCRSGRDSLILSAPPADEWRSTGLDDDDDDLCRRMSGAR